MQTAPAKPSPFDGPSDSARTAWLQRPEKVREPWLTDSIVAVSAPALAVCAFDGQIREFDLSDFRTAHGYYEQDRRMLSRSELTVDGERPEYLRHRLVNATSSKHVCLVRTRQDATPDPEILVERYHRAGRGERIVVANLGSQDRKLSIRLSLAADLADISEVRRGQPDRRARLTIDGRSLRWHGADDETVVTLEATPPPADVEPLDMDGAALIWHPIIAAGERWDVELGIAMAATPQVEYAVQAAKAPMFFERPRPSGDERLDAVVSHGIDDMQALLLALTKAPDQVFAAAGAPWYLTLFGRDSLWTARLMLPVDPHGDLAFGTLHALAALQGRKDDPVADEQPGKILHELRRAATTHQQGEVLPPVYYGSIDATPLFVLLLVEAYRETRDRPRTLELVPMAREAVNWMRRQADADGSDHFIRHSTSHTGALYNFGWKDSYDAIVNTSRQRATGAIALSEVQAYAFEAAMGFANLLRDVFAGSANEEARDLEDWAAGLKRRFMAHFQVTGDKKRGTYFAIALDGDDKVVDGLTSNMGHLLTSGILNPKQSAQVAGHLVSGELFSGWGLRTRESEHPCFSPMSYHGGAVWTHDTAIAIRGLADAALRAYRAGEKASARKCAEAAHTLADGLLAAAQTFDYRLPELFSGGTREPGDVAPLPFPTSCKPQAWSAASGVAVWHALDAIAFLFPGPASGRRRRLLRRPFGRTTRK